MCLTGNQGLLADEASMTTRASDATFENYDIHTEFDASVLLGRHPSSTSHLRSITIQPHSNIARILAFKWRENLNLDVQTTTDFCSHVSRDAGTFGAADTKSGSGDAIPRRKCPGPAPGSRWEEDGIAPNVGGKLHLLISSMHTSIQSYSDTLSYHL